MKKKYQILYKGIITNELSIFETYDFKMFQKELYNFTHNKYNTLLLLQTNITDLCF